MKRRSKRKRKPTLVQLYVKGGKVEDKPVWVARDGKILVASDGMSALVQTKGRRTTIVVDIVADAISDLDSFPVGITHDVIKTL